MALITGVPLPFLIARSTRHRFILPGCAFQLWVTERASAIPPNSSTRVRFTAKNRTRRLSRQVLLLWRVGSRSARNARQCEARGGDQFALDLVHATAEGQDDIAFGLGIEPGCQVRGGRVGEIAVPGQ